MKIEEYDKAYVTGVLMFCGVFNSCKGRPEIRVRHKDGNRFDVLLGIGGTLYGPYKENSPSSHYLYILRGKDLLNVIEELDGMLCGDFNFQPYIDWRNKHMKHFAEKLLPF